MARTADQVIVELEARTARAIAEIEAYRRRFGGAMDATGRAAAAAERQILRSNNSVAASFRSLAGSIAATASVAAIVKYADSYTRLQNSLKVAGLEGDNLMRVQDELYSAANRNGVAVEVLGSIYSRAAITSKELGASQADLLKFTNAVSDAVRVTGGGTEAARGAMLQLSQAIGGTVVHAEEFNSIQEGLLPILQAAAKNMDKYGGSVSKLRADVLAGKVTSQEFFQAILKGSADLANQAAKANLTIAASLQVLNNEIGRYVGATSESLSASERLSAGIVELSKHIDVIAPALAAIAVVMGARLAVGLGKSAAGFVTNSIASQKNAFAARQLTIALNEQAAANARLVARGGAATAALRVSTATMGTATAAARALGSGLLSAFGGPVGLAITAVAAAIYLVVLRSAAAEKAISHFNETLSEGARKADEAGVAISDLGDKTKDAAKQSQQAAKDALDQGDAYKQLRIDALNAAAAIAYMTAKEREGALKRTKGNISDLRIAKSAEQGQLIRQRRAAAQALGLDGGSESFVAGSGPFAKLGGAGAPNVDAKLDQAFKNIERYPAATQDALRAYEQQKQIVEQTNVILSTAQAYEKELLDARGTATLPPKETAAPAGSGGATGSGKKAKGAGAIARASLQAESAGEDAANRAASELLNAQAGLIDNIQDRAEIEKKILEAERKAALDDIEQRQASIDLSKATEAAKAESDAQFKKAVDDTNEAYRVRAAAVDAQAVIEQDDLRLARRQEKNEYLIDELRARQDLAKTAGERSEIELQILEIQKRMADEPRANELRARQLRANAASPEGTQTVIGDNGAQKAADAAYQAAREREIEAGLSPLSRWLSESKKTAAEVTEAFEQVEVDALDNLTDGLASIVTGTQSVAEAFSSMAKSIINDLARIAIQQYITGPLANAAFGKVGEDGSRSGGWLDSLFDGKRAAGGPVRKGGAYIVGEKRPEVFVPDVPGKIVPSLGQYARGSAMGEGRGSNVTYRPHLDFRGVVMTEDLVNQLRAEFGQGFEKARALSGRDARKSFASRSNTLASGFRVA